MNNMLKMGLLIGAAAIALVGCKTVDRILAQVVDVGSVDGAYCEGLNLNFRYRNEYQKSEVEKRGDYEVRMFYDVYGEIPNATSYYSLEMKLRDGFAGSQDVAFKLDQNAQNLGINWHSSTITGTSDEIMLNGMFTTNKFRPVTDSELLGTLIFDTYRPPTNYNGDPAEYLDIKYLTTHPTNFRRFYVDSCGTDSVKLDRPEETRNYYLPDFQISQIPSSDPTWFSAEQETDDFWTSATIQDIGGGTPNGYFNPVYFDKATTTYMRVYKIIDASDLNNYGQFIGNPDDIYSTATAPYINDSNLWAQNKVMTALTSEVVPSSHRAKLDTAGFYTFGDTYAIFDYIKSDVDGSERYSNIIFYKPL